MFAILSYNLLIELLKLEDSSIDNPDLKKLISKIKKEFLIAFFNYNPTFTLRAEEEPDMD